MQTGTLSRAGEHHWDICDPKNKRNVLKMTAMILAGMGFVKGDLMQSSLSGKGDVQVLS